MIESFKSTLLRWNGWLNRWWKIFHLPTDPLRITLTLFSPWLNDQSIKKIGLRIARILNWAESEILFPFLRAAQPTQIQSFSTNIRPSFKTRPSHSLPQSAEHPIEHTSSRELREHWIGLRVRCYAILSHCSADSSSELFHEHTTFPQEMTFPQPFLNWLSIQLNIHTTENCANTKLDWGRDSDSSSHGSIGSNLKLFH